MKKTILFLAILLANQLQCIELPQIPDMTPEQKETINNFYRIAGRVIKYHKRVAKGKEVDWRYMVIKNGTTGEFKYPEKRALEKALFSGYLI